MSDSSPLANPPVSEQLARRMDRLCDRFEAAWKAGRRPRLEHYLHKLPPTTQAELLRELLVLELEYRYQGGEKPESEEYYLRFPQHRTAIDVAFSEAKQATPPTTYLLPRWAVNRLVSQVRTLVFRQGDWTAQRSDPFSLLARILSRTSTEDAPSPGAARSAPGASGSSNQPGKADDPSAPPDRETRSSGETFAGTLLGDYELLEQLGKGGMGLVYRARQRSANRIVAVKVIRADRLEQLGAAERQEWFERFRREAHIAACLEHDNLVALYEVGEADGQHFYSMRFVDGRSLAEILRKGPATNDRAALYLEQVARALHALHLRGIVHRDLKPRNILVDSNDRPYVTDFGLAKWSANPDDLTQLGAFVGTPEYMAPEQARNPAGVETASDIYSLGATLYELLTGRPPFRAADPVETLRQVQDEEPLSPRRLNPAVHRDLELICLKCLEKEPHKRYASALEVAEELRRYRNGEPLRHTRAVGKAERVWRWCRRKPLQAAFTGLAAFLLLAVTALSISLVFIVQLREEKRQTQTARQEADRFATQLALEEGQSLCELGEVARGMFLWANQLKNIAPGENPDLEHAIRANLGAWGRQISPLKAFLAHPDDVVKAIFSPDGKTVLTVSGKKGGKKAEVRLWDAATGKPIGKKMQHDDTVDAVAFSSDGRTILTGSKDGTARRWDAATGEPLGEPYRHAGEVIAVAFGGDGKTHLTATLVPTKPLCMLGVSTVGLTGSAFGRGAFLAVATANSSQRNQAEVRVWDGQTGEYRRWTLLHKQLCSVVFGPEGKRVLTTDAESALLWDLDTGKRIGQRLMHPATIRALAFSANGDAVLTGCADKTARLWDAATGQEICRFEGHQGEICAVGFSPDSKMILTGSKDWTVRLWDAANGAEVQRFRGHRDTVSDVALSHDGKIVITGSADKSVRLWDAATGYELGAPLAHTSAISMVAISQDGKTILTRSSDNKARLWGAAPASQSVRVLSHSSAVHHALFSIDGRTILTGTWGPNLTSGEACLWNGPTKKLLGQRLLHEGRILAMVFSPDGRAVLIGSSDKTARFWDVATGQERRLEHNDWVHAVAFSPDGKTALTGSTDHTARIWNLSTGQARPLPHPDGVYAVAFSHDGRHIVTGCRDGIARLWDVATEVELRQFKGHGGRVYAVALSPDDKMLLTGSLDMTARLWETSTGSELCLPLQHLGRVRRVAIDELEGKTLLTASDDGTASLWNATTGTPLGKPLLHQGGINALALSLDGKMVLTGSTDTTARLWDAATGAQIGPALLHPAMVWAATFSPDGKTVITGSEDQKARLWDVPIPVEGNGERIDLWTRVITGMTQGPNNLPQRLDVEEWYRCRRQLEAQGGPPIP